MIEEESLKNAVSLDSVEGDPDLSILIVNYNGRHWLGPCLDSVRKNIDVDYEVIVVDNASTDGSVDFLRSQGERVRLLCSDKNLGFVGGNKLAASIAKGRYLLLLNPDTELQTGIASALRIFTTCPKVGLIGGAMYGTKGQYRYSAGYFPRWYRLLYLTSRYKRSGPFADGSFDQQQIYKVDWVEGSLMLLEKATWDSLRGMDDEYFMYGEDVDLCRRIYEAGNLVCFYSSVHYVHHGGWNPLRMTNLVAGFLRYHRKYSDRFERILAFIVLTLGLTARVMVFAIVAVLGRRRYDRDKVVGCWLALCQLLRYSALL